MPQWRVGPRGGTREPDLVVVDLDPGPPATIVEELAIPFGAERNMYDLRDNEEFLALYGRLWRKLQEQIS